MSHPPADGPLVSIVLPTYKRVQVLPYAIRSVLGQSYRNLELIVVDDNSPDETPEIVKSFDDPRLRYVRNEPNLRLPRALNRGFAMARGDYLTWTSDDNLYGPTALERMVERLSQGDCDLVYADFWLFADIDDQGQAIGTRWEKLPDQPHPEQGNNFGACFLYTRRAYEAVGDYDPELFLVEDYDYFIRIAQGFQTAHIPEPLYYFRRHDDALFCSRYAEVKACDVLVRYKNGLLDERAVAEALTGYLLENSKGLKRPWLRWGEVLLAPVSWRLTVAWRDYMRRFLLDRLHPTVSAVLHDFRDGRLSFKDAKLQLMDLTASLGALEYRPPVAA